MQFTKKLLTMERWALKEKLNDSAYINCESQSSIFHTLALPLEFGFQPSFIAS